MIVCRLLLRRTPWPPPPPPPPNPHIPTSPLPSFSAQLDQTEDEVWGRAWCVSDNNLHPQSALVPVAVLSPNCVCVPAMVPGNYCTIAAHPAKAVYNRSIPPQTIVPPTKNPRKRLYLYNSLIRKNA